MKLKAFVSIKKKNRSFLTPTSVGVTRSDTPITKKSFEKVK